MHHVYKHRIIPSRAICIAGALACFGSAVVFTPTGARSQLTPSEPAARATIPAAEATLRPINPTRDAFAPSARVDDDPQSEARKTAVTVPPQLAALHHADFLRPPATMRLAAVATGARPIAIVEIAGSTRTFTIGDALDGSRIASIERAAVVLANGRRLSLAPALTIP